MGGKLQSVLYTMGQYDIVVTAEFPSDEVVMSFLLALGGLGNVRSTTLKAFPESEAAKLIERVP